MNKDIIIITEGEFDAKVLQKLLKDRKLPVKYEILSAYGYSSALSKVKSLMTIRNNKIILLLDTDTIEKNEIRQKEDFVNSYVNTNLIKDNFKTFWSIPEFEIIFLDNKKFLTELTHKKFNKDFLDLAKTSPRRTLESISKKTREEFIKLLDKKEIRDEFFKSGLIKEICDYIEK
ncbi:hypothetical protein [Runella sp.]|jgi:hypothetical protein|uniref:hypothetical protein n=1 Tax=Runella sp. TaxID=1960881 RepID=UPI00262C676E|nr:hypothetical protein [Runella sp.]